MDGKFLGMEKKEKERQATSDKPQEISDRQQEEYQTLYDKYLRLQAEFENARKRHFKEKEEYLRFAHSALVQELLPVYDHFIIALSNIHSSSKEAAGNHEVILQGIEMIQNELWELLSRNGLSKIETVGKPFDPEQHEAIETVEDVTHPEGTVIEEIRPGYLLNGKLLRPASVKITKKGP